MSLGRIRRSAHLGGSALTYPYPPPLHKHPLLWHLTSLSTPALRCLRNLEKNGGKWAKCDMKQPYAAPPPPPLSSRCLRMGVLTQGGRPKRRCAFTRGYQGGTRSPEPEGRFRPGRESRTLHGRMITTPFQRSTSLLANPTEPPRTDFYGELKVRTFTLR